MILSAGTLTLDLPTTEADGPAQVRYWFSADASAPKPVLFYSPGWDAASIDNLSLIEALADQGFAVISLHYPQSRAGLRQPLDFTTATAANASLLEAERRVKARSEDVLRVLRSLDGGRPAALPNLRLDRLGAFGYSLGGAVAAELCARESRFGSAFNLDGWHFGQAAASGVPCHYLLLSDGTPLPDEAQLQSAQPGVQVPAQLAQRTLDSLEAHPSRQAGLFLTLLGSRHVDFADASRSSLWGRVSFSRRGLSPERSRAVVIAYATAWFAQTLAGQSSALLQGPSPDYPEVRVRVLPGAVRPLVMGPQEP